MSFRKTMNAPLLWWSKLIKRCYSNRFLRNASWISACEIVNRATRLITAIVLARYLSPLEFGVAAVALTSNDLIKVLAQNGVGAKIIQASEQELESICKAAYRINWCFCGGLFVLQCIVAVLVANIYQRTDLAYMIAALALVYLMMPFALVQAFLIQRANRLNVTAVISASQTTTDNLITVVLAMFGLGIWAVILPKILVAPIWVFGTLSQQHWQSDPTVNAANANRILRFGRNILGTEVAKALRLNIDNILIAYFLGLEIAGIYFFAKNAGLGISLSLINAFSLSLFAHLCDHNKDYKQLEREFFQSIKIVTLVLLPIILLQGCLAHWYVPVVFGEQWAHASFVLMLLCFSAIPRPFGEAACELLKSLGNVSTVFRWNLLFTCLFVVAIFIGQYYGLEGVAIAILTIHFCYPIFCIWCVNKVFSPCQQPDALTSNS